MISLLMSLILLTTAPASQPAQLATLPISPPSASPAAPATPATRPANKFAAPRPVAPLDPRSITPPIAQPFDPLATRPMSKEFSVLLSHSMFVRGHLAIDTHREGGAPPPPSRPVESTTAPSLKQPEESLVFNGVTVANGSTLAFIENTNNQTVQTVHVGESIAQGKIMDITLDTLSYRNAKGQVVLHIGQDLRGNTPAFTPSSMPTAETGDGGSGGAGGGDSVLERMRKRRQEESLGK